MAGVYASGRAVVRNPEPTKPVLIRASQADLYLRDVLVPSVADHLCEQKDLVLLPKGFAKTFFVDFEPMILHRVLRFARCTGLLWMPSTWAPVSRMSTHTNTRAYSIRVSDQCSESDWHRAHRRS